MGAAGLNRRTLIGSGLALAATPALARLDDISQGDTMLVAPDGREVLLRVTYPTYARSPLPLLVLSHGANGTLNGLNLLQRSLTRGRVVIAPQHPDSEDNPQLAKVDRALLFGQRVADMRLMIDQLVGIERLFRKRVDRSRIAAGGHSFGALIAQALGGAKVGSPPQNWRDVRIKRVVAFSPPGPIPGYATPEGWAAMAVPQFVQTGTTDVVPMIAPKWESHMASFDAATVPESWLWVANGVDHYFGNRIQRLQRAASDQAAAFRLATDIADAFLRGSAAPGLPDNRLTERMVFKRSL